MLVDNEEYFGKRITEWTPEHKHVYVITGMIAGKPSIAENRVGKVVQVRLEVGDFGSDLVLLRHRNDDLIPHANQSYYLIPEKFKSYLDEQFKDTYEDDADSFPYTLQGKESKQGFIIASPIGEGESTPMRDIKSAINNKLNDMFNGSV